jgi:large subunit ribosomal protein L30
MATKLKVTLVRSTIGQPEYQGKVVAGLGLKKPNRSVILNDTLPIRGMIRKVCHLVKVEKAS